MELVEGTYSLKKVGGPSRIMDPLAHLVLVPALLALTIRPVVTSALAAVLWLAMMKGVGAAWWPVVVHAAWWLAAV